MHPTITIKQAQEKVEDYFRQALTALPPQARPSPNFVDTYDCDDPTDGGPAGRRIASVDYRLDGLAPADFNRYFDDLKQWWTQHGFRVLDDARPKGMYLWVENNTDGFRMAAQANDRGELYLGTDSPCVWPDGTPPPT